MEMSGGEHLLYSPQIMDKPLNHLFEYDVNVEKERFRAICFLLQSDKTRYGELL